MKPIIRIAIKEYHDFTHPYFLGTSPDLPELLVQGNSVEEVLDLAPSVVSMILEAKQHIAETENKQMQTKSFFNQKNNDVVMRYTYDTLVSL